MNTNSFILIIFWLIAFFSFYKYYKIQRKINNLEEYVATCSDILIKNTYNRKYYIYYYEVNYQNNKYILQDKLILPFLKGRIKINEDYKIYINLKNGQDYVTPMEVMTYKLYLFISIALIIIPLFWLY